jgi:hypothetical protein
MKWKRRRILDWIGDWDYKIEFCVNLEMSKWRTVQFKGVLELKFTSMISNSKGEILYVTF